MKSRRHNDKSVRILLTVRRYLSFFLLISFVVTCCMLLFLFTLQDSMGTALTKDDVERAAKLKFGSVVLISLLFTVIDEVRRWFAVTRPVRHIVGAAEKIMNGDFSVRIPPLGGINNGDGFNIRPPRKLILGFKINDTAN